MTLMEGRHLSLKIATRYSLDIPEITLERTLFTEDLTNSLSG